MQEPSPRVTSPSDKRRGQAVVLPKTRGEETPFQPGDMVKLIGDYGGVGYVVKVGGRPDLGDWFEDDEYDTSEGDETQDYDIDGDEEIEPGEESTDQDLHNELFSDSPDSPKKNANSSSGPLRSLVSMYTSMRLRLSEKWNSGSSKNVSTSWVSSEQGTPSLSDDHDTRNQTDPGNIQGSEAHPEHLPEDATTTDEDYSYNGSEDYSFSGEVGFGGSDDASSTISSSTESSLTTGYAQCYFPHGITSNMDDDPIPEFIASLDELELVHRDHRPGQIVIRASATRPTPDSVGTVLGDISSVWLVEQHDKGAAATRGEPLLYWANEEKLLASNHCPPIQVESCVIYDSWVGYVEEVYHRVCVQFSDPADLSGAKTAECSFEFPINDPPGFVEFFDPQTDLELDMNHYTGCAVEFIDESWFELVEWTSGSYKGIDQGVLSKLSISVDVRWVARDSTCQSSDHDNLASFDTLPSMPPYHVDVSLLTPIGSWTTPWEIGDYAWCPRPTSEMLKLETLLRNQLEKHKGLESVLHKASVTYSARDLNMPIEPYVWRSDLQENRAKASYPRKKVGKFTELYRKTTARLSSFVGGRNHEEEQGEEEDENDENDKNEDEDEKEELTDESCDETEENVDNPSAKDMGESRQDEINGLVQDDAVDEYGDLEDSSFLQMLHLFQRTHRLVRLKRPSGFLCVRWQNGTVESGIDPSELVSLTLDSFHQYFPGDRVHDERVADGKSSQAAHSGVVLESSDIDRTALVQWRSSNEGFDFNGPIEKVSAYSLTLQDWINILVSDIVIRVVAEDSNEEQAGHNLAKPAAGWVGEVIDRYGSTVIVKWNGRHDLISAEPLWKIKTLASVDEAQNPEEDEEDSHSVNGSSQEENQQNNKLESDLEDKITDGLDQEQEDDIIGLDAAVSMEGFLPEEKESNVVANQDDQRSTELVPSAAPAGRGEDSVHPAQDAHRPTSIHPTLVTASSLSHLRDDVSLFATVDTFEFHLCSASASSSSTTLSTEVFSPGFVQAVQKEWASLSLALVDIGGIYIHACESRLDLLRAVIVGPKDTPYSDILFIFDLSLPDDYPNRPPTVMFHSHGKRLNPNLYADGKVCLSILNTWQGTRIERWDKNSSNLLRVLLSLQALVFVENPYYNEAGYSGLDVSNEAKFNSKNYNERVTLLSLRHVVSQINSICGTKMAHEKESPAEAAATNKGGVDSAGRNPTGAICVPEDFADFARRYYRDHGHLILQRCEKLLGMHGAENNDSNGEAGSASNSVISGSSDVNWNTPSEGYLLELRAMLPEIRAALACVQKVDVKV
mmetsp:Transcript_3593/g.6435  ORF Transcript_3593/g.6435 Transcript_3593/m.6435 type:complete len:1302 (+) Transcript_3593:1285-5190(+)